MNLFIKSTYYYILFKCIFFLILLWSTNIRISIKNIFKLKKWSEDLTKYLNNVGDRE